MARAREMPMPTRVQMMRMRVGSIAFEDVFTIFFKKELNIRKGKK